MEQGIIGLLAKMPPDIRKTLTKSGVLNLPLAELEQRLMESANNAEGGIKGFRCEACKNRGYFHRIDKNGYRYNEECTCMARRRSEARIAKSGLSELLTRYTFETWEAREGWQRDLLDMALRYVEEPQGWFMASGTPGTGKTHICTAICGELMKRGLDCQYMLWRDVSVRAKACVNDDAEYQAIVEPLKRVKVLYIDDLFKTKQGDKPTAADVNFAFEIINARYYNKRLITLISSELKVGALIDIDAAMGSRIRERTKGHYADLSGKWNWRLG